MENDDFIRLFKDPVMPFLPFVGIPACLSPEREDGNHTQLGLRQLLPKPQQYLRSP